MSNAVLSPPLLNDEDKPVKLSFFTHSIRSQLMQWLLVPIILLGILQGGVAYYLGTDFANDAYDTDLADSATALVSNLKFHNGHLILDLPPAAQTLLQYDNIDRIYYQVRKPDGTLIAGDPGLGLPAKIDPDDLMSFRNGHLNNHHRVRIVTLRTDNLKNSPLRHYQIQVAETYRGREKLIANILISVILPQLSLIALTALIVFIGITRGLSPLDRLRNAVASRSPRELHPVKESESPREVLPLVRAINNLLENLAEDLNIQRRFVSNAAHQLRTPLAGLKTQVELALRQNDPADIHHALVQIHTSVQRAGRLVEQLLTLARSEPEATQRIKHDVVDLDQVVREATREFVPFALQKKQDLGYEGQRTPMLILGDPASLHELICNLLDNAIRYTQPGGQITVRLQDANSQIALVVEDNGPGIPMEQRNLVFERFYRVLGNEADGSGLGLAIVNEIVAQHEGRVQIEEGGHGQGTAVTLHFPVYAV